MVNTKLKPVEVIQKIRESFYGSTVIYTEGSCSKLYEILKCIFPEAKMYSNIDHVLIEIDGLYYDILGQYTSDLSEYNIVEKYSEEDCRADIADLDLHNPKVKALMLKYRQDIIKALHIDEDLVATYVNWHIKPVRHMLKSDIHLPLCIINAIYDLYGMNIQEEMYYRYSYTQTNE